MPPPSERTLREGLSIGSPAEMAAANARSYLADGRCVGWTAAHARSAEPIVIDAELADMAPPMALVARFGADEFWERWTRAECVAKIADVPISIWLRDYGLGADAFGPVQTIRVVIGDTAVVVSAAGFSR